MSIHNFDNRNTYLFSAHRNQELRHQERVQAMTVNYVLEQVGGLTVPVDNRGFCDNQTITYQGAQQGVFPIFPTLQTNVQFSKIPSLVAGTERWAATHGGADYSVSVTKLF